MSATPTTLPRLLRLRGVIAQTGLGRTTLFDMVRCGKFPPPVRLTSSARAWIESEVSAWIEARVIERNARLGVKTASRMDGQNGAGGAA